VKSGDEYYWCEKYLPNFQKFWYINGINKCDMISNTTHYHLKELQKSIYDQSEQKHTIVDLQGIIDDNKNYILTDVEYTNTLSKLGWDENVLLNSYKEKMNDYNQTIKIDNQSKIVAGFSSAGIVTYFILWMLFNRN